MSWKNIKTFLILLFLAINIYLILSSYGLDFKRPDKTYISQDTLSDTINIIKKNYNIIADKRIVPTKIDNLGIIDVRNIIYTDKFKNAPYDFKIKGSTFEAEISTMDYSYSEDNAKSHMIKFLSDIGIENDSYTLNIKKDDSGLICIINEVLGPYSIFNGKIKAVFSPKKIVMSGSWHIADKESLDKTDSHIKMTDITGVMIDMASSIVKSDGDEIRIIDIDYGYFVSYYDEKSVSKSSAAIPCYVLKSDNGCKYYYDALNGKQLKQEV